MDDDELGPTPPASGTNNFGHRMPLTAAPTFRALLELIGATHADAAVIFDLALQTVSMKASGRRAVRTIEMATLFDLWKLVREGRVDDLPEGTPESIRTRAKVIRSLEAGIL